MSGPYTPFNELPPEAVEVVKKNWEGATQFINEAIVDHLIHMEGDDCVIPACSSAEFATLMMNLTPIQAKVVAHAAIVRIATIMKESTGDVV